MFETGEWSGDRRAREGTVREDITSNRHGSESRGGCKQTGRRRRPSAEEIAADYRLVNKITFTCLHKTYMENYMQRLLDALIVLPFTYINFKKKKYLKYETGKVDRSYTGIFNRIRMVRDACLCNLTFWNREKKCIVKRRAKRNRLSRSSNNFASDRVPRSGTFEQVKARPRACTASSHVLQCFTTLNNDTDRKLTEY